MSKKFDKFQDVVLNSYEGGEFSYCKDMKEVRKSDDGLFAFLMSELSEKEGCDSFDEAVHRLEIVQRQVGDLIDVFSVAAETEADNQKGGK